MFFENATSFVVNIQRHSGAFQARDQCLNISKLTSGSTKYWTFDPASTARFHQDIHSHVNRTIFVALTDIETLLIANTDLLPDFFGPPCLARQQLI